MLASIRGDEMKGNKQNEKRVELDYLAHAGAFKDSPSDRTLTMDVHSHGSATGESRNPARILRLCVLFFLVVVIVVAILSLAGTGGPPTTPPAMAGGGIPTQTPTTIYVTATPISQFSTELSQ